MGTVYAAWDRRLERTVVIKVPRRDLLANRRRRDLFLREIEGLKQFDHPHVARILDKGEHKGMPFAVLQYCEGGSLEDRLRASPDGKLDPDSLLPWLRDVARALDVIHARGVVHRDVKPANILFDRHGNVCISDFGVARSYTMDGSGSTGLVGSPAYMAPEQALGTKLTGAADQYSLAVSVYQALAGHVPFQEKAVFALLFRKQREKPRDLGRVVPEVSPAVAATVMRAMSRDAVARYPSCTAFAEAFEGAARAQDAVRPAPARRQFRVRIRRPTGSLAWVVALLCLLVALSLVARVRRGHERPLPATGPPPSPELASQGRPPSPPEPASDDVADGPPPPPCLHLDEPDPDEFLTRRNVHVAGSVDGWERGGTLRVGDVTTPIREGRFETWIDAGAEDGPFTLLVRFARPGTAEISLRRRVVIDTTDPVIELSDTLTADHTVTGRLVEANPAWIHIDGEAVLLAPGGTFRHVVPFGNRPIIALVFEARDLAGHTVRVEKRYRGTDAHLVIDPDAPQPSPASSPPGKGVVAVRGRVSGPAHPWRIELNLYAGPADQPDRLAAVPGARASIGVDADMGFDMRFTVEEEGPYLLVVELYSTDGFRIDRTSVPYMVDMTAPKFGEVRVEREAQSPRGVVIRGTVFDENLKSLTCNGTDVALGPNGMFTARPAKNVDEADLVARDAAGNESRQVISLQKAR